ncbi:hypothetical protein GCM10028822_28720 [Hymenobacter terrigena]
MVSPVYRAEVLVEELVQQLVQVLEPLTANFEIILVDDRNPDQSWASIQAEVARDPRVRGLRLSRNFGQHQAMTLARYWVGQIYQPGYASHVISIWFFSGLLLSVFGMVGLYVGATFERVKNCPLYIADEETR